MLGILLHNIYIYSWGHLLLLKAHHEQFEAAHKSHQMHAQNREITDRRQRAGVTTCIGVWILHHHNDNNNKLYSYK